VHVDVTQDVSGGHDGLIVEAAAIYWKPVAQQFDLGFRFAMEYANNDYMSSYFDVTPTESARTGLRAFNADSGFKDIQTALMGMYHLSETWHLAGAFVYGRLFGDAEDSPVVDDRGDANQLYGGLSVIHSW
jgi:MipA family protein